MPRASNPLKNYNHLFALESADSKELRKTFSVSRYEFTFEFAVLFFTLTLCVSSSCEVERREKKVFS